MLCRYFAYGLTIDSELVLPELGDPLAAHGPADVTIRLGIVARYGTDGAGLLDGTRWLDPQKFWLHTVDTAHYLVSDGHEITVMVEPDADPAAVRGYLLGSVCGAMLLQRGFLVLHGNAIRVGDGCLVCVGASGAGKSTTAAGFLQRGFDVLADDVVAVDTELRAIPGFARIKLWQDAADQLGLPTDPSARVFPGMDKYNMPVGPFDHALRLPIRWIYELTNGAVDRVRTAPIERLERFRLLAANTYRHEYLEGEHLLAGHMEQCSRLASATRISQVVRPVDGFSLDALIDCLLEDVSRTV